MRRAEVGNHHRIAEAYLLRYAQEASWLARMIARKPRMLVAIALANKMARTI